MSDSPKPAPVPVPLGQTGYLAPEGREAELRHELGELAASHDRLLLAAGPPRPAAWVRNVWFDPVKIAFESINQGARALRSIQRSWVHYPVTEHRRAALIQDKLPHVSGKPLTFPGDPPGSPLGSWTLIDRHTILASARCSSPFPNGELRFIENREAPPNRAYLKVWDALTTLGIRPAPDELCVDLGACPGGWTWVLAELGARVVAVDKAPLDPVVTAMPGVEFRQQSAWALEPAELGPVDWLFSDIACYPERLLRLVRTWMAAGNCRHMVCTIKFQGATDHAISSEFARIKGSRLVHLAHNKHELTWLWSRDKMLTEVP